MAQDWSRVLRGVGLVAEQMAKNAKPIEEQSRRLAAHSSDFVSLLPHLTAQILQEFQQHKNPTSWNEMDTKQEHKNDDVDIKDVNAKVTDKKFQEQYDVKDTLQSVEEIKDKLTPQESKHVGNNVKELDSQHVAEETKNDFAPKDARSKENNKPEIPVEPVLKETDIKSTKITPLTTLLENEEFEKNFKNDQASREWTETHVPSSPIARILGFGTLAAKLAVGTAAAVVKNASTGNKSTYKAAFVSDANAERLAEALCTMRGAALKLGQMLSIQDENLIPPQLAIALDRVRQG